ncbi:MAG: biopolymer transporter ExbD [Rikenellaceae bacterium]
MGKFKKGKKGVPALSTSSLPDIVFMLLFFFMVSTTMREVEMKVQVSMPSASEAVKLEKKSLASYIYVGPPTRQLRAMFGDAPRIQLNDSYAQLNVIGEFIAAERDKLDEIDRPGMTVSLKADADTKMGIIQDVKQELRRANALNLMYAARKDSAVE